MVYWIVVIGVATVCFCTAVELLKIILECLVGMWKRR